MADINLKNHRELKRERRQTLMKFAQDLKVSFKIWIKGGGILTAAIILAYLFARFVLDWDLFYETDLRYSSIFFAVFVFFVISVAICWLVAFILFNTKHRRNTRYKERVRIQGGGNAKKA